MHICLKCVYANKVICDCNPKPVIYQVQVEVDWESFDTVLTTLSKTKAEEKQRELRARDDIYYSVRICSYVVEDSADV